VNPNATWNVSLESYHPYLFLSISFETSTTLGAYSSLPKIRKSHFGSLRPLGVKEVEIQWMESALHHASHITPQKLLYRWGALLM